MDFSVSLFDRWRKSDPFRIFFSAPPSTLPSYQQKGEQRRLYRSRDLRKFSPIDLPTFTFVACVCDLLIVWLKARHWWCHRSTLVNLRNNEEEFVVVVLSLKFNKTSTKVRSGDTEMRSSLLLIFYIFETMYAYTSYRTRNLHLYFIHRSNSIPVNSSSKIVYLSEPTPMHVDNLRNESERVVRVDTRIFDRVVLQTRAHRRRLYVSNV